MTNYSVIKVNDGASVCWYFASDLIPSLARYYAVDWSATCDLYTVVVPHPHIADYAYSLLCADTLSFLEESVSDLDFDGTMNYEPAISAQGLVLYDNGDTGFCDAVIEAITSSKVVL